MCDRLSTVHCSVMDDIDVTQQTQSVKLPDFSFDVYGQLIVRDPRAEVSDHGGAVLSHTHEIQAVSIEHRGRGRHHH